MLKLFVTAFFLLLLCSCIHGEPDSPIPVEQMKQLFNDTAPLIVACFHPSGTTKSTDFETWKADKKILRLRGKIHWKGLVNNYTMDIELKVDLDNEAGLVRVFNDDAIIGRNKQCLMNDWTPLAKFGDAASDAQKGMFLKAITTILKLLPAAHGLPVP